MASGSKCPVRALTTHFEPTATLRALTELLLSTRQQATGSGLIGDPDGCRLTGGRFALAPAPVGRPPMRNAYHVKPSVCFQVFSRQTASRSRLAIPIAGEPPKTRFPWTASFNPSAGSGFKPTANPSPIADTAAAYAPAAPAPLMLRLRPAGRFHRLTNFLLHKKSLSLRFKESKTPGRSCDRRALGQLK